MPPSTWPPPSGLSTPTVSSKDAVFHTCASTRINASAALVYEIVLHVADYPKWNTFVPEVRIINQPPLLPDVPLAQQPEGSIDDFSHMRKGTIMYFQVVMDSKKPTSYTQTELQVTDMSTPEKPSDYLNKEFLENDPSFTTDLSTLYRVSWKQHGGFASKGLKTERFHEIIITGENECELRTWEVYGGVLAYTVKWLYQKTLHEKFELWGNDLKKYAEQKSAERAAS